MGTVNNSLAEGYHYADNNTADILKWKQLSNVNHGISEEEAARLRHKYLRGTVTIFGKTYNVIGGVIQRYSLEVAPSETIALGGEDDPEPTITNTKKCDCICGCCRDLK